MDCSRTSIRQGAAEVTLVYRRDMKDMPASNEVHEAIEEGVTAIFQAGPVRVVTDKKGNVTGVEFIRMALGAPDASGRRRPEPAPGTEFTIPCDRVLLAIGQGPDLTWIGPGLRRRRGDQAAPAQGRLGHLRDRPAGRVRDRRRPDRRGDGRRGDRRGPALRLRRRRLPARDGPGRHPDPPDAGRAAARVPVDRAVHQRGQDAALPDDRARGRGAQPLATSSTSCRTPARTRSPSRPAASSAPARRSASATCAASASSTGRRSRRSSRNTTRAPASGASPRTASPASTTTTSATTRTPSSCASRRAASTAAAAPRSARRSSAPPATTSCGSASTRSSRRRST